MKKIRMQNIKEIQPQLVKTMLGRIRDERRDVDNGHF